VCFWQLVFLLKELLTLNVEVLDGQEQLLACPDMSALTATPITRNVFLELVRVSL
jgi:hypothetical protein